MRSRAAQSRTLQHSQELPPRQLAALELILAGKTDTATAEALAVDRGTISRWRSHPVFVAELNRRREMLWGAAVDKLRAVLPSAVEVVADAIADEANPDRAKLALALLKALPLSASVAERGPTDAVEIATERAKAADKLRRERMFLHDPVELPDWDAEPTHSQ